MALGSYCLWPLVCGRLFLTLSQHAGVAVDSLACTAAGNATSAAVQLLYVVGRGKRDCGAVQGGEADAAVSSS